MSTNVPFFIEGLDGRLINITLIQSAIINPNNNVSVLWLYKNGETYEELFNTPKQASDRLDEIRYELLGNDSGGGGGEDTSDATATASDIIYSKTAYAKGKKITGTLLDISTKTNRDYASISSINLSDVLRKVQLTLNEKATLLQASNTNLVVKNEATLDLDINYDLLINLLGITPDKIKIGETILGVTGTYKGIVDPIEYVKTDEVLKTVIGED